MNIILNVKVPSRAILAQQGRIDEAGHARAWSNSWSIDTARTDSVLREIDRIARAVGRSYLRNTLCNAWEPAQEPRSGLLADRQNLGTVCQIQRAQFFQIAHFVRLFRLELQFAATTPRDAISLRFAKEKNTSTPILEVTASESIHIHFPFCTTHKVTNIE